MCVVDVPRSGTYSWRSVRGTESGPISSHGNAMTHKRRATHDSRNTHDTHDDSIHPLNIGRDEKGVHGSVPWLESATRDGPGAQHRV